ncbi:MAG: TIGR04211 family SH3 domain-containing protein [Pseudomonadota bacterium]
MRARFTCLIAFLLVAPLTFAQTKYVDDTLYLGFYKESDGSGGQFTSAPSGTTVTVLETEGEFSLVRTEKGTKGWVKTKYLVDNPPAVLRIKALEEMASRADVLVKEVETLTEENNYLREEIDKLLLDPVMQEADAMEDDGAMVLALSAQNLAKEHSLERLQIAIDEAMETLAATKNIVVPELQNGTIMEQPESVTLINTDSDSSTLMAWDKILNILKSTSVLHYALLGVALVIGFFLGIVVLDRRIRAKHGGYRIW